MKPAVWRALALCCIAIGIAFIGYQQTLPDRSDFGLQFVVHLKSPGVVRVTGVDPGSPAAKAGIRTGDSVFYGNSTQERAAAVYASPGSKVRFVVNGRPVFLTAPAAHRVQIP